MMIKQPADNAVETNVARTHDLFDQFIVSLGTCTDTRTELSGGVDAGHLYMDTLNVIVPLKKTKAVNNAPLKNDDLILPIVSICTNWVEKKYKFVVTETSLAGFSKNIFKLFTLLTASILLNDGDNPLSLSNHRRVYWSIN